MTRKKKNGNGNNNGSSSEYKLLREFKPKTKNQSDYVRAIVENDVVICTGPAGSGKTAVAVGLACEHLVFGKIHKIIITRPVVESGRSIGFLPGSANDKLFPYMLPILDEMSTYFTEFEVNKLIAQNIIEIAPLNFMRGRNFHRSFVLLDEAQNATMEQIKMFITRIGTESKCVINGDLEQSDLEGYHKLGLRVCMEKLGGLNGVSVIKLDHVDIVRNPIISLILERLEK